MGQAHELLGLEAAEFPEAAPIVPIADSAKEIITSYRTRDETRVGARRTPEVLAADCGTSCYAADARKAVGGPGRGANHRAAPRPPNR